MKLFSLAVPTLTLLLTVGCGGDSPPESSPRGDVALPGPDETMAAPQPATEPIPPLRSDGEKGMLLPDDLPLPDATQPTAPDDGKPKGMRLPDDLQPSAHHPVQTAEHAVVLVGTQSAPAKSLSSDTTSSEPARIKADIQTAPWPEIERNIQATGRVTVVDFWSLSCIPCLREYPQLVALQKKYPDQVRAIGVNVDFYGGEKYPPASYEPKVTAFLQAVGATFPNYICETASDEVFHGVKINALPAVLVFDEAGKITHRFTDSSHAGGFNYEDDIVPAVEKCLAD